MDQFELRIQIIKVLVNTYEPLTRLHSVFQMGHSIGRLEERSGIPNAHKWYGRLSKIACRRLSLEDDR